MSTRFVVIFTTTIILVMIVVQIYIAISPRHYAKDNISSFDTLVKDSHNETKLIEPTLGRLEGNAEIQNILHDPFLQSEESSSTGMKKTLIVSSVQMSESDISFLEEMRKTRLRLNHSMDLLFPHLVSTFQAKLQNSFIGFYRNSAGDSVQVVHRLSSTVLEKCDLVASGCTQLLDLVTLWGSNSITQHVNLLAEIVSVKLKCSSSCGTLFDNFLAPFTSTSSSTLSSLSTTITTATTAKSSSLSTSIAPAKMKNVVMFLSHNRVNLTALSLEYLDIENLDKKFYDLVDIVVCDDHSLDGTTEYVKKRGFAVIESKKRMGFTELLGLGYKTALQGNYDKVIFIDSGSLVTWESIENMILALENEALVVPMTTVSVAGVSISQSLLVASKLVEKEALVINGLTDREKSLDEYTEVPSNTRRIQNSLSKVNRTTDLEGGNFSPFCFGVNIRTVVPVLTASKGKLFTPMEPRSSNDLPNITQLVNLVHFHTGLFPKLCITCFVYRFRFATTDVVSFNSSSHSISDNRSSAEQSVRRDVDLPLDTEKFLKNAFDFHLPDNIVNSSGTFEIEMIDAGDQATVATDLLRFKNLANAKSLSVHSYPPLYHYPVLCFSPKSKNYMDDLFELMMYLKLDYKLHTRMLLKENRSSFDASHCDVLVVMDDMYDITKLVNSKMSLLKIGWILESYPEWLSRSWIGNFDILLASSEIGRFLCSRLMHSHNGSRTNDLINIYNLRSRVEKTLASKPLSSSPYRARTTLTSPVQTLNMLSKCYNLCPVDYVLTKPRSRVRIEILRLAASKMRLLTKKKASTKDLYDFVYFGNCDRNLSCKIPVNRITPHVQKLHGLLLGPDWKATLSDSLPRTSIDLIDMDDQQFADVLLSSKVFVESSEATAKEWGRISSHVFNALVAGALVITDNVHDLHFAFIDTYNRIGEVLEFPTFKNQSDLMQQLDFFVQKSSFRSLFVEQLRKEVLQKHTYKVRANELVVYINDMTGMMIEPYSSNPTLYNKRDFESRISVAGEMEKYRRKFEESLFTASDYFEEGSLILTERISNSFAQVQEQDDPTDADVDINESGNIYNANETENTSLQDQLKSIEVAGELVAEQVEGLQLTEEENKLLIVSGVSVVDTADTTRR